MILAIDIGNTRIKWGLHDGIGWHARGAVALADAASIALWLPRGHIDRTVIANVAGVSVAESIRAALGEDRGELIWARSLPEQCGVRNGYDDPSQLGVDRWVALIGAYGLHGGSCVVANAGTATTVDVLDESGVFRGGIILPGIELMRRALAHGTAGLTLHAGAITEYPRTTADAIESGCMQAQLGAVERQFAKIAGAPGAICMVSGGAGAPLYEALQLPKRLIGNLVLEGLARIGAKAA